MENNFVEFIIKVIASLFGFIAIIYAWYKIDSIMYQSEKEDKYF